MNWDFSYLLDGPYRTYVVIHEIFNQIIML